MFGENDESVDLRVILVALYFLCNDQVRAKAESIAKLFGSNSIRCSDLKAVFETITMVALEWIPQYIDLCFDDPGALSDRSWSLPSGK